MPLEQLVKKLPASKRCDSNGILQKFTGLIWVGVHKVLFASFFDIVQGLDGT